MSDSSPLSLNNVLNRGIAEVSASAALIGCRAAESLTLGNKGPAGLPWAVMSFVGEVVVVRACIAAITPGGLRETLAVRNPETDAELGWTLDIGKKNIRSRTPIGPAVGIMRKGVSTKSAKEDARDVYAFDRITSASLGIIPGTCWSDHLKVYIVTRDIHRVNKFNRDAWEQALGLAISSIKLVEVLILWRRSAVMLSLVTGASWAFFFFGASVLLALQLTCDIHDREPDIDILAGKLPAPPIATDGERKLVLGTPSKTHENIAWQIFWFLGCLVCTSSILITSLILGSQDRVTCYTWVGFQIIWLALRYMFFHLAKGTETVFGCRRLSVKKWNGLQEQFKERVRGLVFAFSRYQMHVHPRGASSYHNDLQIVDNLGEVKDNFHLGHDNGPEVCICITGVLGDTLLSSASYVFGSSEKLTVDSLYDSAIVGLRLKNGSLISIPCARVLVEVPPEMQPVDPENPPEPEFVPRGVANSGGSRVTWHHWIPCDGNGRWLHVRHPIHKKLEGDVMAEVVTDEHLSEQLRRGKLLISLKDVEEVKEIVRNSRKACRVIVEMLQ